MGEVVTFAPEVRLDEAWKAYQAHASRAVDNPRLLIDRAFFDEYVRLDDRYKRLLLALDGRP